LENVELILEAFDYLQLPFALKQGIVSSSSYYHSSTLIIEFFSNWELKNVVLFIFKVKKTPFPCCVDEVLSVLLVNKELYLHQIN
jgi:hypothetical protein